MYFAAVCSRDCQSSNLFACRRGCTPPHSLYLCLQFKKHDGHWISTNGPYSTPLPCSDQPVATQSDLKQQIDHIRASGRYLVKKQRSQTYRINQSGSRQRCSISHYCRGIASSLWVRLVAHCKLRFSSSLTYGKHICYNTKRWQVTNSLVYWITGSSPELSHFLLAHLRRSNLQKPSFRTLLLYWVLSKGPSNVWNWIISWLQIQDL